MNHDSIMYRRHGKRLFDVMVSAAALVMLAPMLLLLAILVQVYLGAPVLFRQQRSGFNRRPFTILKFRTMTNERDASGKHLPDIQRLTRLGRFLRDSSLDELPELINVLRGDMSLVGPRPLLVRYLDRYSAAQLRRHEVKPGITGWAQVNGRNALTWEEKFRMDVWYRDHACFGLDLKILWLTLLQVVYRKDVGLPGHGTNTEFLGSSDVSLS